MYFNVMYDKGFEYSVGATAMAAGVLKLKLRILNTLSAQRE